MPALAARSLFRIEIPLIYHVFNPKLPEDYKNATLTSLLLLPY